MAIACREARSGGGIQTLGEAPLEVNHSVARGRILGLKNSRHFVTLASSMTFYDVQHALITKWTCDENSMVLLVSQSGCRRCIMQIH